MRLPRIDEVVVGFLLGLMANPNLLEHESFTDLLWAVFHLTDELTHREDVSALADADLEHLATARQIRKTSRRDLPVVMTQAMNNIGIDELLVKIDAEYERLKIGDKLEYKVIGFLVLERDVLVVDNYCLFKAHFRNPPFHSSA
jgi:hypothetical protein